MAYLSYIPARDSMFEGWLQNFTAKITAAPATYGLISGDAVICTAQYTAWHAAYLVATTPATRTKPSVAAKDAARALAESVVRPYAQRIKVNPVVTNAARSDVGVTVNSFPPTPIPAPLTSPVLMLVRATPLAHMLQFRDSLTPTSKSKPYGVRQLALFRAIGLVAATDPAQCRYLGGYTKSPLQTSFDAGDRGKICTYFARWENASGPAGMAASGPFSDPINVIVI